MIKNLPLLTSSLFFSSILFTNIFAQEHTAHKSCSVELCGGLVAEYKDKFTFVPPPKDFLEKKQNGIQTATITVNYTGFTPEAQTAFQYAVDIWASQLTSAVTIEVEAEFKVLGANVLGSAGGNYFVRDFTNAPVANTFYTAPLANKLAGSDIFAGSGNHDINANFNSNFANWYFGTDGNTPSGQFDFVSVVLHELCHGLGFAGTGTRDNGTTIGQLGLGSPLRFSIFDLFVENGSGTAITTLTNPSVALGNELVSDDLFVNGANAVLAHGGTNPKLFVPTGSFDSGSSYSHWNDATYPAGNPNSLMTHAIGTAEAIHSPGNITLGFFEDMGWTTVDFQPENQPTNFNVSGKTSTTISASFTASTDSPDGYIILRKQGSSTDETPIDATTYSVGNTIGDATVVAVGASNSFTDSGLTLNTNYFYDIFAFNGSGTSINYLENSPLEGNDTTSGSDEPTNQPTNLIFNSREDDSLTGSFTNAVDSPDNYLVLRKQGSSPTGTPTDGNTYSVGNTIGDGTVVAIGNSNSFTDTGLSASTEYFYDIFSFNGTGASSNFLTTSPLENSETTLAAEPVSQATNLNFAGVTTDSFVGTFTAGSGVISGYLVLRKENSSPTGTPTDGTTYTEGNTIGDATVVSVSSNLFFIQSSLTSNTNYFFDIFAFSGSGTEINYLTSSFLEGSQRTNAVIPNFNTNDSPVIATPTANNSGGTNFSGAGGDLGSIGTQGGSTAFTLQNVNSNSGGIPFVASYDLDCNGQNNVTVCFVVNSDWLTGFGGNPATDLRIAHENAFLPDNVITDLGDGNYEVCGTAPSCSPFFVQDANDTPLSIVLSSFRAVNYSNKIELIWETESEFENLGFEIFRSENIEKNFVKVDSYLSNPNLKSEGNNSNNTVYSWFDEKVEFGKTYFYFLRDVEISGKITDHKDQIVSGALTENESLELTYDYVLKPSFPNPFNPSTTIQVELPTKNEFHKVSLEIFNIKGELVKNLFSGTLFSGKHNFVWNGKNNNGSELSSGIYFLKFTTPLSIQTQKITFLK